MAVLVGSNWPLGTERLGKRISGAVVAAAAVALSSDASLIGLSILLLGHEQVG